MQCKIQLLRSAIFTLLFIFITDKTLYAFEKAYDNYLETISIEYLMPVNVDRDIETLNFDVNS